MEQTQTLTEEDFKRRSLKEAGLSYSVGTIAPMLLLAPILLILGLCGVKDFEDADWYKYLCYLLPQLCLAGAAILFFKRSRFSVKKTYCACKWYYFPIAVLLQFGLLFSLSELNEYFIRFLELFGYDRLSSSVPSLEGWNLFPAILVIAVLPALFEETLFRGILVRQTFESGWGTAATVLISGALFSLYHHNPEQTIYQFLCGACFTLVAVRSGSVFPTVVAHFLNNAAILILESVGYGTAWTIPWGGYLALCLVSAACLLGTMVYLVFFDCNGNRKGGVKYGKVFALALCSGIAFCAVQWIAMLVEGLS